MTFGMSGAAFGTMVAGIAGAGATMYSANKSAGAAGASEKDYRNTQFTDEQSSQLSEMLSSMDKDVAEEIFGTETLQQLQQSVSQQQQSTTGQQSQQQQQEQQQQTSTDQTTQGQTDTTSQQQQETTTTTQLGDEQTRQRLSDVLNTLGGGSSADDAMDVAMQQVLRSGAPAIANVGNRSGTFGSTAEAQLQNDLITKAAEAGTTARLDQQNTEMNQLLQAIQAGQQGTATEVGTGTTTGQESTQSQQQMQQMQDLVSSLFGQTDTTTQQDSTTQTSEETSTDSTSTSEQQRNASEQTTQEQQQSQESSSQSGSDQYFNTNIEDRNQRGAAPGIARGIAPNAILDEGSGNGAMSQVTPGSNWSVSDPRGGGGGGSMGRRTMNSQPQVNLANLMQPAVMNPQDMPKVAGTPQGGPSVGNNQPVMNPELLALLDTL
jgi:3-dehydroquinate dehydratase